MRALASLAVCLSAAAYGQSAANQQFEVASIKPSPAAPNSSSGIYTGHGRLDAKNVTLERCIIGAYGVGPQQISGGPDWLKSERFEILAKADRPIDDDAALMAMLQALLAGRFKLALHRETRTITALVLEVAKNGPKLEKAEPGEAVNNTSNSNRTVLIDSRHTGMDSFARVLARQTDRPVINRTGLQGLFNLKLHWAPDELRPAAGEASDEASLFTSIQEQLGLRLRAEKAPIEILVIDHVEQPSEN